MAEIARHRLMLLFLLIFIAFSPARSAPFHGIGINYGQLGDNLPSPNVSIDFIKRLGATAVKIYDANPAILRALCGSNLVVAVMVPNGLLPSIGSNQSAADDWISSNILPFYPCVRFRFLLAGNEIFSPFASNPSLWPFLVQSMTNLHRSLDLYSIRGIKVSTTHAMEILQTSFPPSSGQFRTDIAASFIPSLLGFLKRTSSYFFIDVYPYFEWSQNNIMIPLDYALFQNSPSYFRDPVSGLIYTNLLDQLIDTMAAAMAKIGFADVQIGLSETGWPNAGDLDQFGANVHNAAIYNREVTIRASKKGGIRTPARPKASIPIFIFALYNENQKPGPGTERHFGLLYPNGTEVYEVDLTGKLPEYDYPPLPPARNNKPFEGKLWCVLDVRRSLNASEVADALSFACGQGKRTCEEIQAGGKCFLPNTLTAHANYAFNSYWQQLRPTAGACYFNGLAVETTFDPSYGSCIYPSL